jgi:hypothetical protein
LNFTSPALTNRQTRGTQGKREASADHRDEQREAAVSSRKTLQARSAIQIDRAAKRRIDTLLFELAKHFDDTRSTRFT